MLWVLVLIAAIQLTQIWVCGLSLITLLHVIPRVMFAWRITGTVFRPMTLAAIEGVGLFLWVVWRGLIMRTINLPAFLVYVVCVLVCTIIYYVDTERNVYDIADDDDYV